MPIVKIPDVPDEVYNEAMKVSAEIIPTDLPRESYKAAAYMIGIAFARGWQLGQDKPRSRT